MLDQRLRAGNFFVARETYPASRHRVERRSYSAFRGALHYSPEFYNATPVLHEHRQL